MTAVSKRVYIGGLYPGVTETELKDRFSMFGNIERVDIKQKKQLTGFPEKTFAYIDFSTTEDQLKKCFSIFNKTKWKGHELKLQLAKENFIERLKEERQNNFEKIDQKPKKSGISKPLEEVSGVKDFMMSGAVPGTPVTEEKTWIVGKYGRVLPVVHIRSRDKRKVMKVDPSKFCHFVKKLKDTSMAEKSDDDFKTITWNIEEEDSEMMRKRRGDFPKWQPKSKIKKFSISENQKNLPKSTMASKHSDESDFEIVSSKLDLTNISHVYFSEESDDDTDDYESMRNKLPKRVNGADSKTEESTKLSSQNVIPKLKENIGKTEKSKLLPVTVKCFGEKDQNETLHESSRSSEESSIIMKFQSKHNITSMPTSVIVPASSKSSGSLKKQGSDSESATKPKSSKPKLQPFRGIKQLYESYDHPSTKVGSLGHGCQSKVDLEVPVLPLDHHSNETLSSSDTNASDSDADSVSSADTEVMIAAAKRGKAFCSTSTAIAKPVFPLDHHNNKSSSSSDTNASDSDADSVSSADTEVMIAAKEDKVFSSPSTAVKEPVFTPDHHSNKNVSSYKKNVPDSDDESVPSADTEIMIAAAKKNKAFCSPCPLSAVATPVSKTSVLDEFSSGLLEGKVQDQGWCSSTDDSDIEDDFEKLVQNGLSKQSNNQSVSVEHNRQFDELDSETEIEVVSLVPDVNETLPASNSNCLSPVSGGERISLVTVEGNSRPSLAEDKIQTETKDFKDVASSINKKSVKKEKNKKPKENASNLQDSVKISVNNEKKENLCVKRQQSSGNVAAVSNVDRKIKINQKRLESLEERKKVHTEQKSLIKQALASIDKSNLPNKKIVFDSDEEVSEDTNTDKHVVADKVCDDDDDDDVEDDDDEEEEEEDDKDDDDDNDDEASSYEDSNLDTKRGNTNKDVKTLFESSSDEDGEGHFADDEDDDLETFRVRPQFEGSKGQKLMELQMRFGNDERFKLDERFVDEEEGDQSPEVKELDAVTMDEKSRALRVLQEVVGSQIRMPVDNKEKSKRLFRDMSALQYDPHTEHHKNLEIDTPATKPQTKKKSKTKRKPGEEKTEEIEIPEVGKDRYYEVSETLADVFRSKDTTSPQAFSLLAAFGTQQEEDDQQENKEQDTVDHSGVLSWQTGPVLDSSEESDSEEEKYVPTVEEESKSDAVIFSNKVQTFFFTEADGRIAEGTANFCRHGDLEDIREKWQEKRPRLVELYRKKHKRVLRNARTTDKKRIQYKNLLQKKEMLKF